MIVEQLYVKCLSEASYYIQSEDEAVVIDPLREVDTYIEKAKQNNAKIKYIFETHFHADFVSGHLDLARKTGATIVFGPGAVTGFDCHIAEDNEEFVIGNVRIKVLHTPGHTMESTTYLLKDEQANDYALFTGDTLFIGDVGRPDLAQKNGLQKEDLARHLYHSLRTRIMPLSDELLVYPAHGAGSSCGKNMRKETFDTLGNQKKTNYALRSDMSVDEFIEEVTRGLMLPPQYFPKNVNLNKKGCASLDTVLQHNMKALSVEDFEQQMNEGVQVLDVRDPSQFTEAHIPGSLFIGLNGAFAPWVGTLIEDMAAPLLLVVPEEREKETVSRLARVGYDHVAGFLKGGFEAWKRAGKELACIENVSPVALSELVKVEKRDILDVRRKNEYITEHVKTAIHYPLDYINSEPQTLNADKKYFVYCAGGYRSVIAISILKRNGYTNLVNIPGGYGALKKTSIAKTDNSCLPAS